jgi:hypothetical protein
MPERDARLLQMAVAQSAGSASDHAASIRTFSLLDDDDIPILRLLRRRIYSVKGPSFLDLYASFSGHGPRGSLIGAALGEDVMGRKKEAEDGLEISEAEETGRAILQKRKRLPGESAASRPPLVISLRSRDVLPRLGLS